MPIGAETRVAGNVGNLLAGSPLTLLVYNEVDDVVVDTETTIATFTATALTVIKKVFSSSEAYAEWTLFIDAVEEMTWRTGPDRSFTLDFDNGRLLESGSVIDVKAEFFANSDVIDFECSIYGAVDS